MYFYTTKNLLCCYYMNECVFLRLCMIDCRLGLTLRTFKHQKSEACVVFTVATCEKFDNFFPTLQFWPLSPLSLHVTFFSLSALLCLFSLPCFQVSHHKTLPLACLVRFLQLLPRLFPVCHPPLVFFFPLTTVNSSSLLPRSYPLQLVSSFCSSSVFFFSLTLFHPSLLPHFSLLVLSSFPSSCPPMSFFFTHPVLFFVCHSSFLFLC